MAKGYKLIHGTDTLDVGDGKTYYPGDTVPISEAQVRGLMSAGLLFEGVDVPSNEGETASLEVAAPGVLRKS